MTQYFLIGNFIYTLYNEVKTKFIEHLRKDYCWTIIPFDFFYNNT